jgi:uncharacterized protein (DUF1330 family)
MDVSNAVDVDPTRALAFFSDDDDSPIVMLNLLTFKEHADYADESLNGVSGREAYLRYGDCLGGPDGVLAQFGAHIIYSGDVTGLLLGEITEPWDAVALVHYPSTTAMLNMVMSEAYRAVDHHRYAGLAGQLNIRTQSIAR